MSLENGIEQIAKKISDGEFYLRIRPFLAEVPAQESQILLESKIYFGPVLGMDDPSEGRPAFLWVDEDLSRQDFLTMSINADPFLSAARRKVLVDRAYLAYRDPTSRAVIAERCIDQYRAMYAGSSIACFTENFDQQRMWAQYSNKGSGYGLVFDFNVAWPLQSLVGHPKIPSVPFQIKYVEKRPEIAVTFSRSKSADPWLEVESAILTKSSEWIDQKESRLFRIGVPAGLVDFPKASLVAIILGHSISEENRAKIIDLRDLRQQKIPIYQSVVDLLSYKLRFTLL